jgi:ribonuclease R
MMKASKTVITALNILADSHTVPDSDTILTLLKKHNSALSLTQLAKKLKLSGNEVVESLKHRLRAMERDGQLIFDRRCGYRVTDKNILILGRVIGHRDGFGFLARDEGGDDLLLGERDMTLLFDGDRAQVRVSGHDRRGREKASLVKVIERNTTQIVGKLNVDEGDYFIKPENSRIAHKIDIDNNQLMGAKTGQYVVVTLTDYPCDHYRAFGRVTEVLGNAMAPGMEIEVAIRDHDIPHVWPVEVVNAAKSMGKEVIESDKLHRVDLRDLPFVTIDGEDARDFDDAVYCQQQGRGWRLWVAIADVSHYVTPGSALDQEAQKRGTSVYFPGHVVPMLPEALSNGLCSLNPNVDRLVMVCEMQIDKSGNMTGYQFSEAVIHSHARLTYNQVNALLTKPKSRLGQQTKDEYAALIPHINALHQLYGALKKARATRGSMDFDTQEVQFQFNKERKVDQILPVERNDAHKLIEECMLCANVATASFLEKLKLPALYRNHNGPQPKKLQSLRAFLGEKGLKLSGGNEPTPIHYDQLLRSLGERPDTSVIQSMMLRSLSQAEYSPDNIGHFGLAYSAYAHFTSPIRRYPDLLVHRAIRSVIRGKESGGAIHRAIKSITSMGVDPVKRINSAVRLDRAISYPYDTKNMQSLGMHCSQLSRRADKASWDVDAWLKCDYMRERVGDTFTGVITTVTHFGLFVELADTKIEGLIHISSLNNDFYQFDEAKQALIGNRNNNTFAIGDAIEIRIAQVDMDHRKIEFNVAGLTLPQKKVKKTRKNKRYC